jgi:hypothetical protein
MHIGAVPSIEVGAWLHRAVVDQRAWEHAAIAALSDEYGYSASSEGGTVYREILWACFCERMLVYLCMCSGTAVCA